MAQLKLIFVCANIRIKMVLLYSNCLFSASAAQAVTPWVTGDTCGAIFCVRVFVSVTHKLSYLWRTRPPSHPLCSRVQNVLNFLYLFFSPFLGWGTESYDFMENFFSEAQIFPTSGPECADFLCVNFLQWHTHFLRCVKECADFLDSFLQFSHLGLGQDTDLLSIFFLDVQVLPWT